MSSSFRFRDEIKDALKHDIVARGTLLPEILEVEKVIDRALKASRECDLDTTVALMESVGWRLAKIQQLTLDLCKKNRIDPGVAGQIIDDLTRIDNALITEVRRNLRKCEVSKYG